MCMHMPRQDSYYIIAPAPARALNFIGDDVLLHKLEVVAPAPAPTLVPAYAHVAAPGAPGCCCACCSYILVLLVLLLLLLLLLLIMPLLLMMLGALLMLLLCLSFVSREDGAEGSGCSHPCRRQATLPGPAPSRAPEVRYVVMFCCMLISCN